MNPKTTIALVLALLLAVIGVYWARSSSESEKTAPLDTGPKKLLEPALGELVEYEVKVEGRPALLFQIKDTKWHMVEPVSWPGDHYVVDGDAKRIKDLEYVKVYDSADPDAPTPQMTSLDKPTRVIKLTDKAGKSYVVRIGARQALSEKTYVQREGDDRVYLVASDLNALMKKDVDEYRGKNITQFAQNDAERVEVSGEQAFVLVKQGRDWIIEAPVRGRADSAKVGNILRALASLRVASFVDDAPASLRPYGLEEPHLLLAVETEKKTPKPVAATQPASAPAELEYDIEHKTIRLALGGIAGDEVFARLLDDETQHTVFKVAKAEHDKLSPDLASLRDKQVAPIKAADVRRISVESGGETVSLSKIDDQWRIDAAEGLSGAAAEFAAVDDLLRAVSGLQANGFEPEALPTYGLDAPRATIALQLEGRLEPTTLQVGGLTPSKTGAYIRNVGEDFIAVVSADAANTLVVSPVAFRSRDLLKFARAWASRLEIDAGGAKRVVVRDGGAWKFAEPVQGKAEMVAVNNILSDLSNLRGRRVVGSTADAAAFGLDKPNARVVVTVESPPKPKTPPTTQTSQPAEPELEETVPPVEHTVLLAEHDGKVYAMVQGGSTVCEVDAKVMQDVEAELFDTRVASLLPEKANKLVVSGSEPFSFTKDEGGQWLLDGEASFQTDPTAVTNYLNAIRDLRATRFVAYTQADAAQYGLDAPVIIVEAETEDGDRVSISLSGTGPAEGGRYAMLTSQPGRIFVVGDGDYAKFDKKIRDFHKAE